LGLGHDPVEPGRCISARLMVDVDLRGRQVRVTHVALYVGDWKRLYGDRAEGVAQIVESEVTDIRSPQRGPITTPQGGLGPR
jgi:hypothetical protein